MARIFFKKDSLTKYKIAIVSNAVNEFIKAIKRYEPTKFEVVYNENNGYHHYDISVYGVHLYTVIHKPFNITIDYKFGGYDVFDYDDIYNFNDLTLFHYVTDKDNLTNTIDEYVNQMSMRALHGLVRYSSEKYSKEPRGNVSVYTNNSYITFGYGLTVDSNIVDTRFSEAFKNDASAFEEVKIQSNTAYDQMEEIINDVVTRIKSKIDMAHNKYNTIKETIGGVTINLDGKRILCHRSFRPLITGGFITFKCPYTNSIVSMKSTNYNCVIVDGLDEVYGSDDSIVLIGNN